MNPILRNVENANVSIPPYSPSGNECTLFEMAWTRKLPLLLQRTDRLRQDAVCKPYGRKTRPAAFYGFLP